MFKELSTKLSKSKSASYFANNYRVNVVGVTLSKEQISYANQHFNHPNVEIVYRDYREISGHIN